MGSPSRAPLKGKGKLKCRVCNKPYRDHKRIGPCEELHMQPGERMTSNKPYKGRRSEL
jgi:hypothetical protein